MLLSLFIAIQVAAASPVEARPVPRDISELQCVAEKGGSTRKIAREEAFKQLGGGSQSTNPFAPAMFKQYMMGFEACSATFQWNERLKTAANLFVMGDMSVEYMRETFKSKGGVNLDKIVAAHAAGKGGEGETLISAADQKMLAQDLIAQGLNMSEEQASENVYVFVQLLEIMNIGKRAFLSGKGMAAN